MTSSLRFKSFMFGIIFASTTWAVSLYLYWRLTQDSSKYTSTQSPFNLSSKYSRKSYVNLPYEDDFKKFIRSKSKYFDPNKYENSDKLVKQLQSKLIKPVGHIDEGKDNQFYKQIYYLYRCWLNDYFRLTLLI